MARSGIADRLKQFREGLGITQAQMAQSVGLKQGSYSDVERGKVNISGELLKSLVKEYRISPIWLYDGEGEMTLQDVNLNVNPTVNPNRESSNETYINKDRPSSVAEAEEVYQQREPVVVTIDSEGRSNVVMIDQQAAAGFPAHYQDQQWYQDLPAFGLPWPEFQRGHFICLQASGDSMHPTIYHHDWLVAEQVTELTHIKEGYIHVVLTESGVVVKRILKRVAERSALALKSDNPTYPTYDEPVAGILALYRVKYKLSANLPNEQESLEHRMNSLEAKLTALEANLKRS